jgi:hypothetical protein
MVIKRSLGDEEAQRRFVVYPGASSQDIPQADERLLKPIGLVMSPASFRILCNDQTEVNTCEHVSERTPMLPNRNSVLTII